MSEKHLGAGSEFPPLKRGVLRVYSMRFCPYAERARLILAAKNIPHEIVNVNLVNKPEWFTSRTPFGTVPVLEHDDGRLVYESLFVSEYLDSIYPENRLTPSDPYVKATHQFLIELSGRCTSAFYKVLRSKDSEEAAAELNNSLKNLEDRLVDDFFGGFKEAFVDYMIWPWFERFGVLEETTKFKFDSERYPKLAAWIRRMSELPAAKACAHTTEQFVKFFNGYLQGKPEYDF